MALFSRDTPFGAPYVIINVGGDNLMAMLADVQKSLSDLSTTVAVVLSRIAELKAQVAAGGVASEADLDGVVASLTDLKGQLDASVA